MMGERWVLNDLEDAWWCYANIFRSLPPPEMMPVSEIVLIHLMLLSLVHYLLRHTVELLKKREHRCSLPRYVKMTKSYDSYLLITMTTLRNRHNKYLFHFQKYFSGIQCVSTPTFWGETYKNIRFTHLKYMRMSGLRIKLTFILIGKELITNLWFFIYLKCGRRNTENYKTTKYIFWNAKYIKSEQSKSKNDVGFLL